MKRNSATKTPRADNTAASESSVHSTDLESYVSRANPEFQVQIITPCSPVDFSHDRSTLKDRHLCTHQRTQTLHVSVVTSVVSCIWLTHLSHKRHRSSKKTDQQFSFRTSAPLNFYGCMRQTFEAPPSSSVKSEPCVGASNGFVHFRRSAAINDVDVLNVTTQSDPPQLFVLLRIVPGDKSLTGNFLCIF